MLQGEIDIPKIEEAGVRHRPSISRIEVYEIERIADGRFQQCLRHRADTLEWRRCGANDQADGTLLRCL